MIRTISPLGGILADTLQEFRERSAPHLFELLRQFTRQHGAPFPQLFRQLSQRPLDAVRRFIQDNRPWFTGELSDPRLPPLLVREESFKDEPVGGKAARNESR